MHKCDVKCNFYPPPLKILALPLLVSLIKVLYIFFIKEPSSRKMHGHERIAIRVMITTHNVYIS